MRFPKPLRTSWRDDRRRKWAQGIEGEKILAEITASIMRLTGVAGQTQPLPTTLVRAYDFEQFGRLSFALANPDFYLATKAPLQNFRAEFHRVTMAGAFARLQFLRKYTLMEKPLAKPRPPSKALFLCLAYLHNLLALCREEHAGMAGMAEKSVLDFFDPFNEFCEALRAQELAWNGDDIVVLHAVILNFLAIYAEACPGEIPLPPDLHHRPLQIYERLRQRHPLLAVLLEQLLEFSPLSRFWFLPKGPFHFSEDDAKWFAQCSALFSRKNLPLLTALADYLVSSIFTLKTTPHADPEKKYFAEFNDFALRRVTAFFKVSEAAEAGHRALIHFRWWFYHYFNQPRLRAGLDNFINANKPQTQNTKLIVLREFLESCAWAEAGARREIFKDASDPWELATQSMVKRLWDDQFVPQCQAWLARIK